MIKKTHKVKLFFLIIANKPAKKLKELSGTVVQWFAEEWANLIKQSENKKSTILVIKNLAFYYFTK